MDASVMPPFLRLSWRNAPWTAIFIAAGLLLRAFHYFRNPSMWHDEAALVVNVLQKNFIELLGSLRFAEAAPPLFLWIERAVVLLFGDSTFVLRLVPFVSSCLALGLMAYLATQVLQPRAVPWAMLLAAFSDHQLWHASEAKPYAVEVLVASGVVAIYLRTLAWPTDSRLLLFACLAPVVIFLAYPGCFLCGALLVVTLPSVWRSGGVKTWLAYGSLVAVVFISFAILVTGPVHAQRCDDMTMCWTDGFVPWERPVEVPFWVLGQSADVVGYCCDPLGQTICFLPLIGAVSLWRAGRRDLVAILALPVLLALLAAGIKSYPYAGARVMAYAAPGISLLLAAGIGPTLDFLRERAGSFRRPGLKFAAGYMAPAILVILLLMPIRQVLASLIAPWHRADCSGAAAFVHERRRPEELVLANHWEYVYYFRELGSAFVLLEDLRVSVTGKVWLVTTAGTARDRYAVLAAFAGGDWQVLETREFERTSVFLLSKEHEAKPGSEPQLLTRLPE
jgi:hypothetical protein